MSCLKVVDRIAVVSIFSVIGIVPLAAHAASFWPAGEPDAKVMLSGGIERRFYTSGPMGTTTFRVDVSPAGARLDKVQVLTDDAFNAIRAGMTSTDVFSRIGPPYAKARFDSMGTTAWDYHYRDAWGYDADFSVLLDDGGSVTGKVKVRNGN